MPTVECEECGWVWRQFFPAGPTKAGKWHCPRCGHLTANEVSPAEFFAQDIINREWVEPLRDDLHPEGF